MKLWLLFVMVTVLCWGAYVPTIHAGQVGFGPKPNALRAFMFVGVAYFLISVAVLDILPRVVLELGKGNSARSCMLRAFDADEFRNILGKMS